MATETTQVEKAKPGELEAVLGWLEVPGASVPAPADPEIDGQAEKVVGHLLTVDPKDVDAILRDKNSIQSLGLELQRESGRRSAMLKEPVQKLYKSATEGGDVANALVDLRMKVEELDPGKFDLEPGWVTRTLGRMPFIGSPLKRYFSRYESAKTMLDAIVW